MENVLDVTNPRDLGAELKRSRELRGLTQQQAADILGVARTTITAIEAGERRIKALELIKLARAYGQQVGDFVRNERPKSAPFQPQFRSTYRRLGEEQQIDDACIFELEELSKNYVELEQITENPLVYNYPNENFYKVVGSRIDQIAESTATQERNRLGLGDSPITALRNVFEQEVGLRIFYITLHPQDYSAMYVYDSEMGGCIAVNRLHPVERQLWSLAHEYAHFLVHRHAPDLLGEGYQRASEKERFADTFARYFLMPTTSLLRKIGAKPITRADLFILAHYFGVSVEALTRRLENMRIIGQGTWEDMRNRGVKVREVQEQLGLQPHPQYSGRLPLRYQYLALSALENEQISEGQFTHFMGVSRAEARRIVEALSVANDHQVNLAGLVNSGKASDRE